MNAKIDSNLRPVSDFLDGTYKFVIPSYQRGYRWKPEQVEAMLNDFAEFFERNEDDKKNNPYYCLQPIIVCRRGDEWEVIDGQQRLTTLYIILSFLKVEIQRVRKQSFHIQYETRTGSEVFLEDIAANLARGNENIDYYHFVQAYRTIERWFNDQIDNEITDIHCRIAKILTNSEKAGKNVKVIWYDVTKDIESEKSKETDVFSRYNIGKIPLTNADLVKAALLKKESATENTNETLSQLQIATEWDAIENRLHEKEFWAFLYNEANPLKYETRIEYLLDLYLGKDPWQEYFYSFNEIQKRLNSKAEGGKYSPSKIWQDIKDRYSLLDEWFRQDEAGNEFFHLIGFLVYCGGAKADNTLKGLLEQFFGSGNTVPCKDEFKQSLRAEIHKILKIEKSLEELNYEKDKDNALIRKLLLLFNIETLIAGKTSARFSFEHFKAENWDIEHIFPQTPSEEELESIEKTVLKHTLQRIVGSSKPDETNDLLNRYTHLLKNDAVDEKKLAIDISAVLCKSKIVVSDELKNRIKAYYEAEKNLEYKIPENRDGISNLALLDAGTNRGYKNAKFPIKRATIIDNDLSGKFVPVCTRNVFNKAYSDNPCDIEHWTQDDAVAYLEKMEAKLSSYINKEDKEDGDNDRHQNN